ncbi:MAG: PA14 domain-containing protein [Gemmataceae bacterium]
MEALEQRDTPAVGGGFTNHGLDGSYYLDPNFTTLAFSRRDLRLDFDWGTTVKPGGSTSPGFAAVGVDSYSARWVGQLVPRFGETYTFTGVADDTVKIELRPAGAAAWTTVVDQTTNTGAPFSGAYTVQAGQTYDIRVGYQELTGAAKLRLLWSSPSTPQEVIDPLDQPGMNNPDGTAAFTDIVKGARNGWEGGVTLDANGWPQGNTTYYFQESLNQGVGLDPLMRGTITFSFTGKATLSLNGNADRNSLAYTYNAGTNTTAGSFRAVDYGANATAITFTNTTRTGVAGGPGGITNLKLLRPAAPDATAPYPAGTQFTTQIKDYARNYTVVRHQYVANQQRNWSDRTLPGYFNQAGGTRTAPTFPLGWDTTSDNGWSWEHKVLFANETGTDLMISVPTLATGRTAADTTSYLVKLANLIKYGSDGVNPYTAPTANPVYPPLNPNLRVYLELENELWNWAGVFYTDFNNVNQLVAQEARANSPDFQAINYDRLSTAQDGSGNYVSMDEWRYRYIVLRMTQISDIFRGVFGDAAMPGAGNPEPRVRPLYEWQYDNTNDTARKALTWADRYFNKADPASTYTGTPRPVSYFLWGGGGATYYGANNPNGLTDRVANSGFETPAVGPGYVQSPAGSGWTFSGTAGVARDGGAGDDIPAAFDGSQVGYVAGTGRLTVTFTVPAAQTSSVYAVAFKALNRKKVGAAAADTQTLRVYLDYGVPYQEVDLTARTYSQPNGYTPPSFDQISPWAARNVFWTESQYYYTKSVDLTPGSTHTITLVGTAAADQLAFLEDVRLTSVDAIFAGGMPGGGEATGQPVGSNIRATLNTTASWAAAFGLKYLAYEGGWSLGGDDGGSYVQLKAKYGDDRTAAVQATFMDYFDQAGGAVDVFGTYAQIPSWSDYYAQQGLLSPAGYPILQGISQRGDRVGASPTNGVQAPAVLTRTTIALSDRADPTGAITAAGGWVTWNLIVPRSGTYVIRTATQAGGTAVVLADDAPVAQGTTGGQLTGTVYLTPGLHAIKVRSAAGTFTVSSVTAYEQAAPAAPTVTGQSARNDAVTLTWSPVAGAAGYVVLYGTAPGQYTTRLDVGAATTRTVGGLTNDTTYFFAVSAYKADRVESLPSAPRSAAVLVEGQTARLARWEFTGLVSGGATTPATVAPTGSAAGLTVSPLSRGPGLYPASDWMTQYFPDRFGSGAVGDVWAANLTTAVSRQQYYQFTVTAAPGVTAALSELNLQAWFQDGTNPNNRVTVQYSTNGTAFTTLTYTGSPNTEAGLVVPLAGVPALQAVTGTITFRVYTYGSANYTTSSIGLGTGTDDLVVRGTVRSTPAVESVTVAGGAAQRSMVGQLTVAFNTLVNLAANAFTVTPQAGGPAVSIGWTAADVDGRTVVTITAPGGTLADGRWRVTTAAGAVTHRAGGVALATSQTTDFFRLFGDINGDGTVNGTDLFTFRPAFGMGVAQPNYISGFDYNSDGLINGTDLFEFRTRYGIQI